MSNPFPLIIHPPPYRREGPRGYLLRLASENFLNLADLTNAGIVYQYESLVNSGFMPNAHLDPDLHAYVNNISVRRQKEPKIWNDRYARFCPLCLAEDPYWRVGWEIVFHDACPAHRVWMIDKCTSCGKHLSWNRESLIRCSCGADLRMEVAAQCTANARQLSEILHGKLLGTAVSNLPIPIEKTDLLETQQVIRYLGACIRPGAGKKPMKIREAGSMAVSWSITSYASEILFDWPDALHLALDQKQNESDKSEGRGIRNAFGWAHDYLYKALKGNTFNQIRQGFNSWLVKSWQGGIAKRNRRLLEGDFRLVEWIPAKVASDATGISPSKMERLIREGILEGQVYYSEKGRKTVTVRRDQLDHAKELLKGEMSIEDAGQMLGLSRKRMRAILRFLFPHATRENTSPWSPWHVPRSDVENVLKLTQDLPVTGLPDEDCVTLNFILRYWPWEIMEIVGLIEAVMRKEVMSLAIVEGYKGIGGLAFRESELKAWRERSFKGLGVWLSIPQVCKLLSLKQEVAYQITKLGFLESETLPKVRGGGKRIRKTKVEEFQRDYIFASEINARLGTVSIVLKRLLAERSIVPVSGPGIDDSKKILYKRSAELKKFMDEYAGENKENFSLI